MIGGLFGRIGVQGGKCSKPYRPAQLLHFRIPARHDTDPGYVKSSQVGGVNVRNAEQWDYFVCGAGCGTFQYRQRTRKVRKV